MTTSAPPRPPETDSRQQNPSETSSKRSSPRRSRSNRLMIGLVMLAGVIAVAFALQKPLSPWLEPLMAYLPVGGQANRRLDDLVLETVKRGIFQITVTERGTLDSSKNAVLASKVEGTTSIISIVPEGTHVKAGDLVVELDSSALIEKQTQQKIALKRAEADREAASEDLGIQRTQNESDIAAAKLKLELADIDLRKFKEGDFEQQKNELASQISLAKDRLKQATENYEFTDRLVKKGYKTQNELEAARITQTTEETNLKVAEQKYKLLVDFTYDRTMKELEENAKEFARELERVKRKAKAAETQKNADFAAKDLTFAVETDRAERLDAQIKACRIVATQDGQVIYANTRDGRSSDQILIETGASVRERQPIVTLPDLNEMKVNARIHESRISMVKPGLPATVKVDAYVEEAFRGIVDTVASVPSSTGSSFMRDIKEYEAIVKLQEDSDKVSKLRPGLTAQIEILVESRENVLQAPIQAVGNIEGKQYAFVISDGKVHAKPVQIGKTNERMLEITSGLEEGEQVVMNWTRLESDVRELREKLAKEKPADAPATGIEGLKPPMPAAPSTEAGPTVGPLAASGAPRPPGGGPGAGGPGGGFDPAAVFEQRDANKDGKITDDEMSERMRTGLSQMDTNGDGALSLDEFKAGMGRMRRSGPPGGGPPGGGREADAGQTAGSGGG